MQVDWACFFNSSGYSTAAQNYIKAIDKSGKYDVRFTIFGGKLDKRVCSEYGYEYFNELKLKKEKEDKVLIYHCIPPIQKRIKSKLRSIGIATFETFNPPENWIKILNNNDAIITPSMFNFRIFSHMNILKPIFYLPHCISFEEFNENVNKLNDFDRFTFLFLGQWRERKGYKQLIEAWVREFSEEDNVQLIIKTDRIAEAKGYVDSIKDKFGKNKGVAPIIFENKILNDEEYPKFLKSIDCLIAPHMGEGFCLPGLQCMALKIPVIITNFSGSQDFSNKENCFLLEPSGFILKSSMDNIPQFSNRKWAFLEVNKIMKSMRFVLENKDIRSRKAENAYNFVKKRFSYEVVSDMFDNIIKEVYG